MQPAGVNGLLVLASGTGAGAANAATVLDDAGAGSAGQQFSQLLSDSGAYSDSQQNPPSFSQGALLLANGAAMALAAQEVADLAPVDVGQGLLMRDPLITAQDAADLLRRLDKMADQPNRTAADIQALGQIKEQLLRIERGGEPKTVIQVVQSAPAVKEAKLSTTALVALLSVRKTAEKHEEKEVPQASALLQNLQAAMFRARGGKITPKAGDAAHDTQKEEIIAATMVGTATLPEGSTENTAVPTAEAAPQVVLVQPLAAVTMQSVPAQSEIEVSGTRSQAELDAMIPSLKLEEAKALPEVELPQWKVPVASAKSDGGEDFKAALAAAAKEGGHKAVDLGEREGATSDVATALNPSQANSFSPTQTVKAAQPINLVPTHGYINHAPVTEQVQVAIHRAAQDGVERMTIQLDPVELGRVEINMATGRDGQTQISFVVDKPETFDGLSRDARMLERSLQEVGIKADTGSMQFNLRQQPQGQQLQSGMGGNGQQAPQQQANAEDAVPSVASIGGLTSMDSTTRNYLFNVREGVDISA